MEIVNLKSRKDLINDAILLVKNYSDSDFVSDNENVLNFVILENNEIIGEVDYSFVSPTADLLFIYIKESERGRGLSAITLEKTFSILKEKEIKEIFLEVRVSNTVAYNLYKKMNFIEIGRRKKYYSNGEDAILIRIEL